MWPLLVHHIPIHADCSQVHIHVVSQMNNLLATTPTIAAAAADAVALGSTKADPQGSRTLNRAGHSSDLRLPVSVGAGFPMLARDRAAAGSSSPLGSASGRGGVGSNNSSSSQVNEDPMSFNSMQSH